jgi:hypothetical protein
MRADVKVQSIFRSLMSAIRENSYEKYVAQGDSNFQKTARPKLLTNVSSQLSPRVAKRQTDTYLGYIRGIDFVDHIWRLSFDDNLGDRQAQLSIKSGKVHAFYIF